jgi:signal transduction histidine kinase
MPAEENTDAAHTRDSQSGLGLTGMRERAALIGATLKITSSPGNGCHIELLLPLLITPLRKEQSATT